MLFFKICNSRAICGVWIHILGARGNVVVKHSATSQKDAGSRPGEANEFVSIYLFLPATLGPGVYSAPNRNEYQEQKNNVSGE
jgi:hypothetical protein